MSTTSGCGRGLRGAATAASITGDLLVPTPTPPPFDMAPSPSRRGGCCLRVLLPLSSKRELRCLASLPPLTAASAEGAC